MGKKLYLECSSGISGDMFVAAMLDLGAKRETLHKAFGSLPVKGFRIEIKQVVKSGITACDFNVILDKEHENYDHDMEYLHGHTDGEHERDEHGKEVHEHAHEHAHKHTHEHRGLKEIRSLIDAALMTERAKNLANRMFSILADAEAKAHGVSVEQVYFHEVGAIDSIVDVLSAAICIDDLDIEDVIVTELCEGKGTIRCQHGILSIPVPAVSNIVSDNGLKLSVKDVEGELVTPTGAAIAAALKTSSVLPSKYTIEKVGIGAGKREYKTAGVLKAMLIQTEEK